MKRIKYDDPINAELWMRLNDRLIKKIKNFKSNSLLNGKIPNQEVMNNIPWFKNLFLLDVFVDDTKDIYIDKLQEILHTIYKSLPEKEKKIVDDFIEIETKSTMVDLYNDLCEDDYGMGVYLSNGMYLQEDGSIT